MQCIYKSILSLNVIRATRTASVRSLNKINVMFSSPLTLMQPTASFHFVSAPKATSQQQRLLQCQWRSYAAKGDLTQAKVTDRVMTVIKLFEKINAEKLTMESHFMKELGLDSLDHVELLMAVEDEFGFEIPDQDAEKLVKPSDVVKYLCQKLEVAH